MLAECNFLMLQEIVDKKNHHWALKGRENRWRHVSHSVGSRWKKVSRASLPVGQFATSGMRTVTGIGVYLRTLPICLFGITSAQAQSLA